MASRLFLVSGLRGHPSRGCEFGRGFRVTARAGELIAAAKAITALLAGDRELLFGARCQAFVGRLFFRPGPNSGADHIFVAGLRLLAKTFSETRG